MSILPLTQIIPVDSWEYRIDCQLPDGCLWHGAIVCYGIENMPGMEATAAAHANLVFAAPDLLAALEEARDALFAGAPVTVGLKHQINAAIAKAKGQST